MNSLHMSWAPAPASMAFGSTTNALVRERPLRPYERQNAFCCEIRFTVKRIFFLKEVPCAQDRAM